MADEGNDSRASRMDLNLYLGPPRSPRPRSSDLGSDLALSSLPLSTSSTTEESRAPLEMSSAREHINSHVPYSPSHASYTIEPSILPLHPADPGDGDFNQEYTPYSPSYEPYAPILPESEDPEAPDSPEFTVHPLPTIQETEEPSPYTPSYIPLDPQEANDDPALVSPLRTVSPLISRLIPPMLPDVSMYAPTIPSYVPRSPLYSPPSPMYSPRSPAYVPPRGGDGLLGRDDESSSRQELYDSPAYRFRRLIESSHRLRLRRFRSSFPYNGGERSDFDSERFGRSASPLPEQQAYALPIPEQQVMHDMISSQRPLETNGKHKVPVEGVAAESSEEEKEEKGHAAANFECNICLDMAQEPVVTSCGHLFCWPCLYQWLHVHSEHKECPVCKGEVTESNVTPIYGRGSSEANDGKKPAEGGESNVKIPPRPRGNRFESLRQQFRPISRRFGEGFATSWRRLVNQQLRARNRFEGHGEPSMFNAASHAVLTRLRARRLHRDELSAEIGPEAEEIRLPRDSTLTPPGGSISPLFHDGFDLWNHPNTPTPLSNDMSPLIHDGLNVRHRPRDGSPIPRSSGVHPIFRDGIEPWHRPRESTSIPRNGDTDPLFPDQADLWHRFNVLYATATGDVGRVVGNGNRYGASTSSGNPSSPEQVIPRGNVASASAADQVSASSTTAVIQGDVGLPEGSAEPNSAGSSRSFRRRGRSSASGSLDVDGVLHVCKRRRLN